MSGEPCAPAADEAAGLGAALAALAPLREAGHEVIVVDGGSADGTPEIARMRADKWVDPRIGPRTGPAWDVRSSP